MMKLGLTLLGLRGFKSSKCKTMAKLVTARIKLLRNKREVVVRQMRRDIALLLQSGQDATARIRVEHVMREQNIMAANEIIELFCELVVARLSIISKQRDCPADLKEGISSLIFAAPRCSDIPELIQIRTIFEKKYGKDFVDAATELRPNCGVNRTLIEKLSVRTPTGEVKLKLMKEIAKEYQIAWDHSETEKELLKPPEELIEGPRTFVSAASMPVKPLSSQGGEANQSFNRVNTMTYGDTASAAKVAAESAEKAVAAAQAAAYLANRETNRVSPTSSNHGISSSLSNGKYELGNSKSFHCMSHETPVNSQDNVLHHGTTSESQGSNKSGSGGPFVSDLSVNSRASRHYHDSPERGSESHSAGAFVSNHVSVNPQDRSHYADCPESEAHGLDRSQSLGIQNRKTTQRRHSSYNAPPAYSDIKFDESDGSDSDGAEEIEMEAPPHESLPPVRSPPPLPPSDDRSASSYRRNSLPRVHPKLPDYVDLAARFEALKVQKY